MRGSHGDGTGNPVVEEFARRNGLLGDTSGVATGRSSDAENDARGSRREGTIDNTPRVKPHFVRLAVASDVGVALVGENAGWTKGKPGHVPGSAFKPAVGDMNACIYGWLADVKNDWHPIENVRRLSVSGGEVSASVGDDVTLRLADFGQDFDAARVYRARVAHYIAEAKAMTFWRQDPKLCRTNLKGR